MLSLDKALDLFLKDFPNYHTRLSYDKAVRPLVAYLGGERIANTVTTVEMKLYDQKFRKRNLAPATVRNRYKSIRRFFSWLMELDDTITSNPARVLKLPAIPEEFDKDRAMTDEEYYKVLVACRSHTRNYALITFMGESGARAIDTSTFTVTGLDLEGCTGIVLKGKGGRPRKVWFGATASEALRDWLAIRPEWEHDFVFGSSRIDKPLDSDDISQIVTRVCRKAGVKPRGSHSLRYRMVKILVDNHVDEKTRMIIMGHKSVQVHRGYMPADTERARKAVLEVNSKLEEVVPTWVKETKYPDPKKIIAFPNFKSS